MNLSTIFGNVSGNTFVGISTRTNPVLVGGKKNLMQGRVTKIMSDASVMVFQNKNVNGYENMVKRRLVKEGKNPELFSVGVRLWGDRVAGTPIVTHNKKNYLEVIFLNSGTVSYELDGVPIDKCDIVGFEKEESSQGGLSDKVIIRTFSEDSITKVKINGNVFA